jgi:hypothetical protein
MLRRRDMLERLFLAGFYRASLILVGTAERLVRCRLTDVMLTDTVLRLTRILTDIYA